MAHSGETGSSCQVSVGFLPGLVKSLLLRRVQRAREREEMTTQPHWSQVQDRGRGGGGRENETVCLTAEYSPSICCTSL